MSAKRGGWTYRVYTCHPCKYRGQFRRERGSEVDAYCPACLAISFWEAPGKMKVEKRSATLGK